MTKQHLDTLQRILSDESQLEAFIAMLDAEKVDIYEGGNPWTKDIFSGLLASITKEAKLDMLDYLKGALRKYAEPKEI